MRAGNRNSMDPAFQATFDSSSLLPKYSITRREGHPRQKWIDTTMREAWDFLMEEGGSEIKYAGSEPQRQKLKNAALNYSKPFHAKKRPASN